MPNIQAVSRDRHTSQRWQRYSNFLFASPDAVVPLVAQELQKAMMSLPVGFVASETGFMPIAVQSLAPSNNMFVAPDGRWLGAYIPAAYRSYPFTLASTESGQHALCIDENSGLVTNGPEGEPFFDEDGQPTKAVTGVLDFLTQTAADRAATVRICAVLQQHGLIQPWPIKVQDDAGEKTVQGLYRIDEAALNALSDQSFLELRKAGALPVAYCQLLSMQHLPVLGQLAQAHAQARAKTAAPTPLPARDLDLEFLNHSDTISFGNLF